MNHAEDISARALIGTPGRPSMRALARRHAGRLRALLFYGAMPALSAINAGVGLLLPMLLTPEQFGRYAIIVTLYQYGLIFDFGLSQLTDRRVPILISPDQAAERQAFVGAVLWTRLYIAAGLLLAGAAVIGSLDIAGHLPYPAAACMLSLAAGIFFMVALGPASVYRASSQRRRFGNINIVLMAVMAVARPAGLIAGGITGCFLALAASYAAMAGWVQAGMPPPAHARPGPRAAARLIAQGLPLFMTSFIWAFYLTANRWMVSLLTGALDTGQFAFGSNVVTLIVGAVGALSQFYYPRIVTLSAAGGAFSVSGRLLRDFCLLVAAVAAPTAVGVVIGPYLVQILYPKFTAAIPLVEPMLLAVPSLVLAAWLMPIALSIAAKPWIEGLVVYPAALVVLLAATRLGLAANGVTGAAWGLVASAGPLLALQLASLRHASLLRWRDALLLFGATALATMFLAMLAFG